MQNTSYGSDSAGVDALAEVSNKTKSDQKDVEDQQKREAALQELIDSKKYVVPLAHDSTKKSGNGMALSLLFVLILIIAGAYLAVDAKVVNVDVNLPYHFFKQ